MPQYRCKLCGTAIPTDEEAKPTDRCGHCGAQRQSTIHMTEHPNAEIRMGAHPFETGQSALKRAIAELENGWRIVSERLEPPAREEK